MTPWPRFQLSIIVIALSTASVAAAQDEDGAAGDGEERYRTLVAEAVAESQAGRNEEALVLFLEAHELNPNARTLRALGTVSYELGLYVDAVRYLEGSLEDSRRPLDDEMKADIVDILARARRFIGRFALDLEPTDLELRVDGRRVTADDSGVVLLDVGSHSFEAGASGYQPFHREVRVEGGEDARVGIRLTPSAEASPEPAHPGPVQPTEATRERASGLSTLFWVGAATGAVGVLTFAVAGGLGLREQSDVEALPCAASRTCSDAEVRSLRVFGLVADAGIGVTVVGAALIAIALIASDDDAEPTSVSGSVGPRGAELQLWGSF